MNNELVFSSYSNVPVNTAGKNLMQVCLAGELFQWPMNNQLLELLYSLSGVMVYE